MRILVLVTDAFGGHGGIAKFNRDLLSALCADSSVGEVVALPRLMPNPPGNLPSKLSWVTAGIGGKLRYIRAAMKTARSWRFDLIICGHINLLPIAFLAQRLSHSRFRHNPQSTVRTPDSGFRVQHSALDSPHLKGHQPPLTLIIHGIEAWQPHPGRLVRSLLSRVDQFVTVSVFTGQRFAAWSGLGTKPFFILPNCVDLTAFGAAAPSHELLNRYHLAGRKVLMTLARLSAAERYKGIDEVLEILPTLASKAPKLAYLICGDGDDRPRLTAKARSLGLAVTDCSPGPALRTPHSASSHVPRSLLLASHPLVVFTGRIPDSEKADHYRLADAYVMPGWGEGFGIVYLEALACGIPVIASKADASREAVRNGELGMLVDPRAPNEIRDGILAALQRPRGLVPPGLEYFSTANFTQRVQSLVKELTRQQMPKLSFSDTETTLPQPCTCRSCAIPAPLERGLDDENGSDSL